MSALLQGQDCFICKGGGHRAKDCPKKFKRSSQASELCLKCGNIAHVMHSCNNDYSPDDLKVFSLLSLDLWNILGYGGIENLFAWLYGWILEFLATIVCLFKTFWVQYKINVLLAKLPNFLHTLSIMWNGKLRQIKLIECYISPFTRCESDGSHNLTFYIYFNIFYLTLYFRILMF